MSTGRLLGEALHGIRRRGVLALGMMVALLGLVYAGLYAGLTVYNPHVLTDLADTLSTDLPPAWAAWLAGGAVLLVLGGLLSEGGLILAAGRRALPAPAGRARGALGRLPQLLAVGALVWWPAGLALALALAPALYWLANGQDQTQDWALAVAGSGCCATLAFVGAWLLLWPQQRLANCALLLDGQPPRAAARTARRLFWGQFGAVLGLWVPLLLLNALLLLVSALLAAGAAGLVALFWGLLDAAPENVAELATGGLALLAGLLLLLWDGAVSAFNLQTWVLAYRALRPAPPPPAPGGPGPTQILGRQRVGDGG